MGLTNFCNQLTESFSRIEATHGSLGFKVESLLTFENFFSLLNSHTVPHPYISVHSGHKSFSMNDLKGKEILFHRMATQDTSIILKMCHEYVEGINQLIKLLKEELGVDIEPTLIYTPVDSQTFTRHWDTEDVLVMQLSGKKKWFLQTSNFLRPIPGVPLDAVSKGKLIIEQQKTLVLNQGEFLCLPRGLLHSAIAVDGPSLHLTMGFKRKNYRSFFVECANWFQYELYKSNGPVKFEVFLKKCVDVQAGAYSLTKSEERYCLDQSVDIRFNFEKDNFEIEFHNKRVFYPQGMDSFFYFLVFSNIFSIDHLKQFVGNFDQMIESVLNDFIESGLLVTVV